MPPSLSTSCHGPQVNSSPDHGGQSDGQGFQLALVGMPNTGKSTLFNRLTGGHAQIANWPGLTVELQRGPLPDDGHGSTYELVDLPGIHDLSGSSEDEAVVQRFLRDTPPDLLVVVLNASQISSQLRLLLQVRQLGLPLLAALNMSDEAGRFGITVDHQGLSQALGLPVLPVSAKRNQGIAELLDQLHQWGEAPRPAEAALQGSPQPQVPEPEGWQQSLVARYVTIPEGVRNQRTRLVDRFLLHPLLGVGLFLVLVLRPRGLLGAAALREA
jgi:ferrous iron transport protein B